LPDSKGVIDTQLSLTPQNRILPGEFFKPFALAEGAQSDWLCGAD
jgi:hypothetical protein